MYCTFAIEVKISATKKSGNVIGCKKKRTIICKKSHKFYKYQAWNQQTNKQKLVKLTTWTIKTIESNQ